MKWLFSSKNQLAPAEDVEKVGSQMLRIKSIDFFGPYSESSDGKYLIACQDCDPSRSVGGYRTDGNGRFILVESGKVLFSKECQRPNDGIVSNNGTVIVCDWLFGDDLGSKLLAYDVDGQQILEHRFSANAYSNGISADGQFAVVQLCSSDASDGNTLYLFDLHKRKILSSFKPETGSANSYEFDTNFKILSLCYSNGRTYQYTFNGEFLASARYQTERIEDASATELVIIVQEKLREPDSAGLDTSLSLLERAYSKGLSDYPDYLALAHRLRGELYEAAGDAYNAIEAYRDALAINSKIGVKKKLSKLEKQLLQENPDKLQRKATIKQIDEPKLVSASDVQTLLYNFAQRAFIGVAIQKIPFEQSKTLAVMSILESGSLSQNALAMLPIDTQRVIYELLTQYIMFVSMNLQLTFPTGFLRNSNENNLGHPVLAYMREHEWPFPQMLPAYNAIGA